MERLTFDQLTVSVLFNVTHSGVTTRHKVISRDKDSICIINLMRDGTRHSQSHEPDKITRREWDDFKQGPKFGIYSLMSEDEFEKGNEHER